MKQQVLQNALDALQKITKLKVNGRPASMEALDPPDAEVRIMRDDLECKFSATIKNVVTRAMIGVLAEQTTNYGIHGLLVASYVTPQIADLLREMNIQFIDAAGNAHINYPPLFIFIRGNKPAPGEIQAMRATRAFRPKGLQVIFSLLCNPGLEKKPFRTIAKISLTALGTVNWVIKDLKEMGFLIDMKKRGRLLVRKADLLNRWVIGYPEQLRSKQLKGRYRTKNADWWLETDIDGHRACWGGEIAANKLSKNLKPRVATIYTSQPIEKLLIEKRMTKDPDGDIEILAKFWNFEDEWQGRGLAPLPLIYADLIATGDPRNIETARNLYEDSLSRLIRED